MVDPFLVILITACYWAGGAARTREFGRRQTVFTGDCGSPPVTYSSINIFQPGVAARSAPTSARPRPQSALSRAWLTAGSREGETKPAEQMYSVEYLQACPA